MTGTSGDEIFNAGYYDGSSDVTLITGTSSGSWVQYTAVFEATITATKPVLKKMTATAGTMLFDTVTLNEVTPGCVAADYLAMDGWYKDPTLDVYREHSGTNTKDGSFYSLKCAVTAADDYVTWPLAAVRQTPTWLDRFAGRTVTFGAWVKTSTATHVYLDIYDGASHESARHTGGGGWEWIEATATISATPTYFQLFIWGEQAAGDFYISQPMLVFGSAIGSGNYSRPSGEIVWFEKAVPSNLLDDTTSLSDTSATTLNLEADSNGAIPKGAKAVSVALQARDSGSASGTAYLELQSDSTAKALVNVNPRGIANDALVTGQGWQPCNSDGDVQYVLEATGSGTFDSDNFEYHGVELR